MSATVESFPSWVRPQIRIADDAFQSELSDMRELQAISTQLIQADTTNLYSAILDASLRLLRSDTATMQLYDAEKNGLKMLATRGFDGDVVKAFDWVDRNAGTSCGIALRSGTRAIIPDIDLCDDIVGTREYAGLRQCGIRAAQSTPLVSRNGTIIGMITNHWTKPHLPSERSLAMVDVLARQAADLIDRHRHEERIVMLAREAEHRSKNLLASVQAVVRLTKADTPEELKEAISGRVNALNNVHRLFVQSNWKGADLGTLIREELAPYCKREDLCADMNGPDILLEPNVAQTISVTFHELATNAAKYGALSVPGGRVSIDWRRTDTGLLIKWKEQGGPLVREPTKRGFGTRVMDSMIRGQSRGAIDFDWRVEGLACEFSLPLSV